MRSALIVAVVLFSCSNLHASPLLIGASATNWTTTDSLEIVLWFSESPDGSPIDVRGYHYDRFPTTVNRWVNLNRDFTQFWNYIDRSDGAYYDQYFQVAGDVPDASVSRAGVVSDGFEWYRQPAVDAGFAAFAVYSIDNYPRPIPMPSAGERRTLDALGLSPQYAVVGSIPLSQLGLTDGVVLLYVGMHGRTDWIRSYTNSIRTAFVPEPHSLLLLTPFAAFTLATFRSKLRLLLW